MFIAKITQNMINKFKNEDLDHYLGKFTARIK